MNDCLTFFRYADAIDADDITAIFNNNKLWFSHIKKCHIKKKIKIKECIFENGVVIIYKILKKPIKLGNILIEPNNTVIEQIVRDDLENQNTFAHHVLTKFLNCIPGSTYLCVDINNKRAINFYYKMSMSKISSFISNNDRKKKLIFMHKKTFI